MHFLVFFNTRAKRNLVVILQVAAGTVSSTWYYHRVDPTINFNWNTFGPVPASEQVPPNFPRRSRICLSSFSLSPFPSTGLNHCDLFCYVRTPSTTDLATDGEIEIVQQRL